jgi:putative N6-adenine-specific DNA methylase
MYILFAVCSPGLETILTQELQTLELFNSPQTPKTTIQGGVSFSGNLESIYRSNLWLRSANRLLVRLGDFNAKAFSELRKKASRLEWEQYLSPGHPIEIKVTCHKSRLYHQGAVAERVAAAIIDRLGKQSVIRNSDQTGETQLIFVRIVRDHCTISIDSSGELLHRRGYRLATAKAPLRETLAAGMLYASHWDTTSTLLDPFCGSGTIAIEAALLARNIPPGHKKDFSFMKWKNYDSGLWQRLLEESKQQRKETSPIILASDRNAGAINIAKVNAERADVAADIDFSHRALSAIEPKGQGSVVTNPPYGYRVSSNKDLRNLYAQFGNVMRTKCPGWQIAILCNDQKLINHTGLSLERSMTLDNGGIKVKLAQGIVSTK